MLAVVRHPLRYTGGFCCPRHPLRYTVGFAVIGTRFATLLFDLWVRDPLRYAVGF